MQNRGRHDLSVTMTSAASQEKNITAIILAAGKGTRMASPLPKVLHPVAGKPMVLNIIEACKQANVKDLRIVLGHGLNLVKAVVEPLGVNTFIQAQQLGTADAVRSAQPETIEGEVLILNGDHPLIEADDIKQFLKEFRDRQLDLAVITVKLKNPKDFGRIVRSQGRLAAIVEAKDASSDTLKLNEVNTGIYLVKADILAEFLPQIGNNNAKKEFYLTDLISIGLENSFKMDTILGHKKVSFGVNTQEELSLASKLVFKRKNKALMESGVLMIDSTTTYIEQNVEVGAGAVIYPNVYLRGRTKIGSFTSVEPNCYIVDSIVGESCQIKASTYLEKCEIHTRASVGPFARLRPETVIGEEAHVGNFVEMKKTKFGKKSKAGHLTYLGDAEVGEEVNVGCGTITCNYAVDKKKYKTVIGDRVFVGSDSQFVAPVKIGADAIIGSGSTITKDVPANALAVARGRQVIKENYKKKPEES
jgi:bifunctional UDP-N-acetylglucosamine pyrophosphorylase / glucosamine-1-phosphate N-acetyltransferase